MAPLWPPPPLFSPSIHFAEETGLSRPFPSSRCAQDIEFRFVYDHTETSKIQNSSLCYYSLQRFVETTDEDPPDLPSLQETIMSWEYTRLGLAPITRESFNDGSVNLYCHLGTVSSFFMSIWSLQLIPYFLPLLSLLIYSNFLVLYRFHCRPDCRNSESLVS